MTRAAEDTLYIVMPAYNEEQNIKQVVSKWLKVLEHGSRKSRLVVADSGCTDSTHQILLDLKNKYHQIEILQNTDKQHGPKVIALYRYAIEKNADYIFQTDSDGQTNPEEFMSFWKNRKKYDGIIGVRKKRGDGKGRAFVERVVCFLLRIFFCVRVEDANAPFRLMRRELLEKYIYKLPEEYSLPNIMLTAYFVKNNEKLLFEEISFMPRTAGKNSIDIGEIIKIGMRAIVDFWHFRKDMMEKKENKIRIGCLKRFGVISCFAMVAGILVMISPAFPWNGGTEMTDSSVFLTIGRQMKDGVVPYVDTFDHKGPLLYLINFFGVMINESNGIFVFEFLAIVGTLWFMFKIFQLMNYKNTWFSVVMTVLLFTPFVNLYLSDGGNLTEQYAMPFVAFSIYAFVKYFREGKLSKLITFYIGASFACVLMLRLNMVGIWVVFCVAVLIKSVAERKYNDLWRYVLWFFLGTASVVAPIIVWLSFSGAFGAFIESYLLFNISYAGEKIEGIKTAILFFAQDIIILTSLCLSVWAIFSKIKMKEKSLMIWYLIAYVFCIVLACMSGRVYPHYGMILAPFTVLPFAVMSSEINNGGRWSNFLGLVIIVMVSLTYESWWEVANRGVMAIERRPRNEEIIELVDNVCKIVEKNTNTDDKITVYGNWNLVYLRCNRLPASKYSYQFPIGDVNPDIMNEYYDDISLNRPKVFVVQSHMSNDNLLEFLDINHYDKSWEENSEGVKVYVLHNKNRM